MISSSLTAAWWQQHACTCTCTCTGLLQYLSFLSNSQLAPGHLQAPGTGPYLDMGNILSKLQVKTSVQIVASKLDNLTPGLRYYIKNLLSLTSLEGKNLIGCEYKQRFVLPVVCAFGWCEWSEFVRQHGGCRAYGGCDSDTLILPWSISSHAAAAGQSAWHLAGSGNACSKHFWTDNHGQRGQSMKGFTGCYQSWQQP